MSRSAGLATIAAVALLGPLLASRAAARDLWTSDDEEESLVLQTSLKSTWLLAANPDDALLYPERTTAASLWRLRFALTARPTDWLTAEVDYEQRTRLLSSADAVIAATSILPSSGRAPYRVTQLDWAIVSGPTFAYEHEIDRAFVAFHPAFGELKIGRQAIGYGRGAIFSAVDVLAPFSPLEVDREWRRGVDAARLEVRAGAAFSADAVAAFSDPARSGAYIGRVRGYVGDADGALMFGRRAEDWMLGGTVSASIADAAFYGEAAFFYTDGRGLDGGWLGSDRWVSKFLAGGSYSFDVGSGLKVGAEYHYSGFGVRDLSHLPALLTDADFQTRFSRGDTQTLGRHAFALLVSYDVVDDVSLSLTSIVSPVDGSGVVAPAVRWTYSDGVTLLASVFVPWGRGPADLDIRSEYGLSPVSVFLQMNVDD